MKDLISVIIPVYNVEKYIDKCLESVVNQTYSNLEIILVDDGSTDLSGKMCDDWAKKDNRIKVIHKENGGQSDARNVGLEVAKGAFISFIDPDDYIDKLMYQKMMQKMIKDKHDMVLCGIIYLYEDGKTSFLDETNLKNANADNIIRYFISTGKKVLKDRIITQNIMGSACRSLYKKELIDNIKFEKNMISEDLIFNIQLINDRTNIGVISDYLYYYLQREGSSLHTFDEKKYKLRENFTKKILTILNGRLSQTLINSYKFHLYLLFLNDIALSQNKELLKNFLSSKLYKELNTKENYRCKQKETKSIAYKILNFLAYKKLYNLYLYIIKKFKK